MEILPAIDLKDEKVVRLTRGDYAQVQIYSDNPVEVAEQWVDQGANWLHLVDLDAALEGKPKNVSVLKRIGAFLASRSKWFEVGGGIRTFDHLRQYIEEIGADRVILGTIACKDPDFVARACALYPGKIAVGIDVKEGKIATQGWTATSSVPPFEFAAQLAAVGVCCIVYTDIQRDGMLSGLNFEGIREFVANVTLPVVVAGGLRDLGDISQLIQLQSSQIIGAITGKAIYEGTLDLREALRTVKAFS